MKSGRLLSLSVVDLTSGISGPYCTRMLAALGAEVTKIEKPVFGDWSRHRGPFIEDNRSLDSSILFNYLNTNKRSISLNLDSKFGQQVVRDLAKEADVLVDDHSTSFMEDRNIHPGHLREINPSLVVTSMPEFDQRSKYSSYRMTELNLYAMSGLMSRVGAFGKPPLKAGGYQSHFMAGLYAGALTTFGIYKAQREKQGTWLQTSSIESCTKIFAHCVDYMSEEPANEEPGMHRDRSNSVMKCKDGYVTVTLYYHQISAIAELIEDSSLVADRRFKGPVPFLANESVLRAKLLNWLSTRSADEAQQRAQSKRLLFTKVNNVRDLMKSEHLRTRRFFSKYEQPDLGEFIVPGHPFRFSKTPSDGLRPAPKLGEANEMVFCQRLGIHRSKLSRLCSEGSI